MIFPELSFEGWVMSHFKWPWEKLAMYDPRTPWEDQETIDYRAEHGSTKTERSRRPKDSS